MDVPFTSTSSSDIYQMYMANVRESQGSVATIIQPVTVTAFFVLLIPTIMYTESSIYGHILHCSLLLSDSLHATASM